MAEMSIAETDQATNALKQWFDSQGIMPGDAGAICLNLIAEQMVLQSQDVKNLSAGCYEMYNFLVVEVARHFRRWRSP